jgi:hypothetical protein
MVPPMRISSPSSSPSSEVSAVDLVGS